MANKGRALVDCSQPDDVVLKEFMDLHPDFEIFGKLKAPDAMTMAMIVRYLVFCYDKNSAIALKEKTRWLRKKGACAEAARFPKYTDDNGVLRFSIKGEEIIFGKNQNFNNAAVRYLSLQYDNDFMMLNIYREMQFSVNKELMDCKYEKPSDLQKAKSNAEEIQRDIEALEAKIFSGDDVASMKSILYETAYQESLNLRPENIATRREQGLPLVDTYPYGKDYKQQPLRFIDDN